MTHFRLCGRFEGNHANSLSLTALARKTVACPKALRFVKYRRQKICPVMQWVGLCLVDVELIQHMTNLK